MKKKKIVEEDSNQNLLGYLLAHSTTTQRNTSRWIYVIVSYLQPASWLTWQARF